MAAEPLDLERNRVLIAAARRFALHGFHGVTLTQLAEDLGDLSVARLYEAFGDKEALFYAAIEFAKASPDDETGLSLKGLLPRVEKATVNSKLKTFHTRSITHLRALDDA